jgi:glycosyltransferase involved in cell wall biosynthesis
MFSPWFAHRLRVMVSTMPKIEKVEGAEGRRPMTAWPLEDATGWNGRLKAEFTAGLVSVVIPTYNRGEWLVEAIESLRKQTWGALEILVVDDGSTDKTQSVLDSVSNLGAGRSLVKLKQSNQGASAARNHGIRLATGEFFIFLDSDDLLVPDAIEHYIEAIRWADSDYCYASIDTMDGEGKPQADGGIWHSDPITPGDFFLNLWLVHAACYRRSLVRQVGPWNESMESAEDHEFILRIKMVGRGVHLARVQGYYRMHSIDQMHQRFELTQNHIPTLVMLENFATWLRKRGAIPRSMRLLLSGRYRFMAVRRASMGDMQTKNRAVAEMKQLLKGIWSPLRLFLLLGWINSPGFYSGLANLKQRLRGR